MAQRLAFRATDPEVNRLGRWMLDEGWTYNGLNGGGHHSFTWTDGNRTVLPSTPSHSRSVANSRAQVRRIMGWSQPKKLPPSTPPKKANPQQVGRSRATFLDILRAVRHELVADAESRNNPYAASHFRYFASEVERRIGTSR